MGNVELNHPLLSEGVTAIPVFILEKAGELGLTLEDIGFIAHLLSFPSNDIPLAELAHQTGLSERVILEKFSKIEKLGLAKFEPKEDKDG